MERRHFGLTVFVLVWLVVLSVPALRLMAYRQLRDGHPFGVAGNVAEGRAPLPGFVRRWMMSWEERGLPEAELIRRHPKDARVQVMAAERAKPAALSGHVSDYGEVRLRNFERVAQQFPDEAWVVATRLMRAVHGGYDNRVAGELEKNEYRPQSSGQAAPGQIARDIAAARHGQTLEPDNSFFDWMLAHFLFAARRDEEALAVLHQAAAKSRYDDHTIDYARAAVAVYGMRRPTLFEEKIPIWAGVLLPHLAKHRHVAQLAVWRGVQAERAGDHARALQIYGDIARLGARMRDANGTYITGVVGMAIQNVAWERGAKLTPQERDAMMRSGVRAERLAELLTKRFAAYAAAHGRADLAREATRDAQINNRLRQQGSIYIRDLLGGIPHQSLKNSLSFWWVSAALLSQLVTAALVWLALSWPLSLARRRSNGQARTEQAGTRQEAAVSGIDVASAVLCIACISAVLLAAAVRMDAGWSDFFTSYDSDENSPSSTGLLATLLRVTPVVMGALLCAVATLWRNWRSHKARDARHSSPEAVPPSSPAEAGSAVSPQRVLTLLRLGLTLAALAMCIAIAASDWGTAAEEQALRGMVIVLLPCLVWWIAHWRRQGRLKDSPGGYGLRWYRRTLGAFMALCSVAYLAVSLASLPLRRQAEAATNAFIQQGEMVLIRRSNITTQTQQP